jgi:serine/threonine-protein kinase
MMAGRTEPRAFGKYQVIATLGRGGMADVYLAALVGPGGFNKLHVIKCLRPNLAEDADVTAMFLDEARLAARLNHRNVVQTYEVGEVDGAYFIAMEYLDGQPLNRLLRRVDRPLPLIIILRILSDALAGLHHAHELVDYDGTPLRVVHRDVSPHNLFVTYDGQVKLVDFGIAKAARRAVQTGVGKTKGKIQYMAPEQAFAASTVDRRADLFSVGAVLWEMIAGRRLWHELGTPEILAGLVEGIPSIRSVKPDVEPQLARICDKALAFRVEDRYATAAELRADLDRVRPHASSDAVGAVLERLFAAERAEMRATIEKQIGALSEGDVEVLADLAPESSATPAVGSTPASPEEGPVPAPVAVNATSTHLPQPTPLPVPQRARPKRRGLRAVAAIIVAGAVVAGYFLHAPLYIQRYAGRFAFVAEASALARRFAARFSLVAEAPASASSAPVAPPMAAPSASAPDSGAESAPPGAATIRLHVAVNPANAVILVDGKPLPSNPFDRRVPKDGLRHRIQIDAEGFSRALRVLVFDRDVEINSTLRPLGANGSGLRERDRK